jgi:hypothetical protein
MVSALAPVTGVMLAGAAHRFLRRYGWLAIVVGRLVPGLRILISLVAGVFAAAGGLMSSTKPIAASKRDRANAFPRLRFSRSSALVHLCNDRGSDEE